MKILVIILSIVCASLLFIEQKQDQFNLHCKLADGAVISGTDSMPWSSVSGAIYCTNDVFYEPQNP